MAGGWSYWGPWGSCYPFTMPSSSATRSKCEGTQLRRRYCNNPTPANGGPSCKGPKYEYRKCQLPCKCKIHMNVREWAKFIGNGAGQNSSRVETFLITENHGARTFFGKKSHGAHTFSRKKITGCTLLSKKITGCTVFLLKKSWGVKYFQAFLTA